MAKKWYARCILVRSIGNARCRSNKGSTKNGIISIIATKNKKKIQRFPQITVSGAVLLTFSKKTWQKKWSKGGTISNGTLGVY